MQLRGRAGGVSACTARRQAVVIGRTCSDRPVRSLSRASPPGPDPGACCAATRRASSMEANSSSWTCTRTSADDAPSAVEPPITRSRSVLAIARQQNALRQAGPVTRRARGDAVRAGAAGGIPDKLKISPLEGATRLT